MNGCQKTLSVCLPCECSQHRATTLSKNCDIAAVGTMPRDRFMEIQINTWFFKPLKMRAVNKCHDSSTKGGRCVCCVHVPLEKGCEMGTKSVFIIVGTCLKQFIQ